MNVKLSVGVGVPSTQMATSRQKPLLAPGNEAEWAQINAEEERASVKAGNVPERALWS